MPTIYIPACRKVDIDSRKLASVARRIERAMQDLDALGDGELTLFGGTHDVSIRAYDESDRALVLASMRGCRTSGGCGAASLDDDGLLRGEA